MVKKLALVRPTKTSELGIDRYSYPDHKKLKSTLICYNRKNNPPNGDFLCEQMWLIEGEEIDIKNFTSDPRVQIIDKITAASLGELFDPPREEEIDIATKLKGMRITSKGTGIEIPLANIKGTIQIKGFVRSEWDFEDI